MCAYYSFRHGRVSKCIMLALNKMFLFDCAGGCAGMRDQSGNGDGWGRRGEFFGFKPYYYSRAIRAKPSAGETSCDREEQCIQISALLRRYFGSLALILHLSVEQLNFWHALHFSRIRNRLWNIVTCPMSDLTLTLFAYHDIYTIHQQNSNNTTILPKHHVQSTMISTFL